jgi:high affinity sulfate transporter 1
LTGYETRPAFRGAAKPPLLRRIVPVSADVAHYRASYARDDLVAGLTVAALAIPAAMAYAELAGLSPINGLYTLLLAPVAYALLGSSRQLVVGPEGSVSTLVAASVLPLAAAGSHDAAELAAVLALMVSGCFLVARLLKLGWVADYFSRPVLIGYLHGVAVVLVVSQLGKLFGLSIHAREPLSQLNEIGGEFGDASGTTAAVGFIALAVLLLMKRFTPKLPGSLIVVVAAIAFSWLADLSSHGVSVVGHIPSGLPNVAVPTPPLSDVRTLIPAALGIFVVSFADGILTARAFAGKHRQHVRAEQELVALTAANAAAGLTQGFAVGASNSRTAVNDSMGARTQIAGLFSVGAIVVILLFLTGPVQYLPSAVLGAVIVSAAFGLVEPAAWRALAAVDRVEVGIAAVTAISVVVFGVLQALIAAVALSLVDSVRRSAHPHDAVIGWVDRMGRYANVGTHPSAEVEPGVVAYRLDDRLFFANARYVKGRVLEAVRAAPTKTSWLVFDAVAMNHVDSTGVEAFGDLVEDLRRDGITLVVARLRAPIKQHFDDAGIVDLVGPEYFYPSVQAAIEAIRALTPH